MEGPMDVGPGRLADQDLVGRGGGLQPGGEVDGGAHDRQLLMQVRAYRPEVGPAGVNTHGDGQAQ